MGVGLGIKDGENLTDLKKVESHLFRILTKIQLRGILFEEVNFLNIVASFKFYNYDCVRHC